MENWIQVGGSELKVLAYFAEDLVAVPSTHVVVVAHYHPYSDAQVLMLLPGFCRYQTCMWHTFIIQAKHTHKKTLVLRNRRFISHFSHCYDKKQLKEVLAYFSPQRIQSLVVESQWQSTGWLVTVCTVRKQREAEIITELLSPFQPVWPQACGMVPPTFRVDIPAPVNPQEPPPHTHTHRHDQRFVSQPVNTNHPKVCRAWIILISRIARVTELGKTALLRTTN